MKKRMKKKIQIKKLNLLLDGDFGSNIYIIYFHYQN